MNSEGIRKVEQIEGLTDADYNSISARIFEFDDKRVSSTSTVCKAKSHCLDLNLNGKKPGIASDGNFSSYLIRRSGYG